MRAEVSILGTSHFLWLSLAPQFFSSVFRFVMLFIRHRFGRIVKRLSTFSSTTNPVVGKHESIQSLARPWIWQTYCLQ
jgi:hypothetical protein